MLETKMAWSPCMSRQWFDRITQVMNRLLKCGYDIDAPKTTAVLHHPEPRLTLGLVRA